MKHSQTSITSMIDGQGGAYLRVSEQKTLNSALPSQKGSNLYWLANVSKFLYVFVCFSTAYTFYNCTPCVRYFVLECFMNFYTFCPTYRKLMCFQYVCEKV